LEETAGNVDKVTAAVVARADKIIDLVFGREAVGVDAVAHTGGVRADLDAGSRSGVRESARRLPGRPPQRVAHSGSQIPLDLFGVAGHATLGIGFGEKR
jgi:hypothetical protein